MSSLKVSLAQLGLVTLTAGALASPACADFSPLEQPLESDFFISAGADGLVFGDGDVVTKADGKLRTDKEASATLLDKALDTNKVLLIGKNLYQDGSLVAGVIGQFVNGQGQILAESPVGVGGYLAYSDLAEDGTGLKLGATLVYEQELGAFADASEAELAFKDAEASAGKAKTDADASAGVLADAITKEQAASGTVTTAKAEDKATAEAAYTTAKDELAKAKTADAAAKENKAKADQAKDEAGKKLAAALEKGTVTAKLFESYALVLGDVAGNPLRLTQTATLTAAQDLNKTDAKTGKKPELVLGAVADVTLSTQFDQLAPALTVTVEQADFSKEQTALDIAAEVGFQATDQIALSVNAGAGREFGKDAEVKEFAFGYGAGLGFQASEGASIGLKIDSIKAGKGKGTKDKDGKAVAGEDITAYAVGLGLDLRF